MLQTTSEVRWLNEKLNELSARFVRVSSLTANQTAEVGELGALFESEYSIVKYRFSLLNTRLSEEAGSLTSDQGVALDKFSKLSVQKM